MRPPLTKEVLTKTLNLEPNLTVYQLAKMYHAKPNTVWKHLDTMCKRNHLTQRKIPTGTGMTSFYKIKGDKRKEVSEQSWKHERDCGDLFTAFIYTKDLPITEWEHTSDQKHGLRFDRAAKIAGKQFYFEIERGTQTITAIKEKVEQYLRIPGTFYVVFTVQDYQPNPYMKVVKTYRQFGEDILNLVAQYRRRAQLVVAPHHLLVENPSAEILVSPEAKYSFQTIQ